ncbi:hypothetical protein [Phenylobacterium sp.]|uniref:hypothetical protein n=1 Tax=Phenylobacterium sp. TaxID=1871053 RepID=UPI0035AFF9D5
MARATGGGTGDEERKVVPIAPKLRAAKPAKPAAPASKPAAPARKKAAPPAKEIPPPPADLREAARSIAGLAMETLEKIMRESGSDTARLAAAREVLDRAGGKPKAGEPAGEGGPVTVVIRRFGADGRELEAGEAE